MSDRNRRRGFLCAAILLLTACASAPGMTTAPPPSDPQPASLTPAPVASLRPSVETSTPKPKDLLFIEFFAIT